MAGPSDIEQLLLEEINAARLNPLADAARYISGYAPLKASAANIQSALNYFNVSGSALLAAYRALTPVQPVAWNETLAAGARAHNQVMIQQDDQTHQGAGELDLGARITAAGYSWSTLGENVYAYAEDALYAHAGFMVDWGVGTDGMQAGAGHRVNIMRAAYREVGVAATAETNRATQVGPWVVTEDFGTQQGMSSKVIVLGVAFNDADRNRFYSLGEGRGDLTIALSSGERATSYASGGYGLTAAAGAKSVIFTGGGLAGAVTAAIAPAAGANVKLDIVNGSELWTSTSAAVSGPVNRIVGLGLNGLTLSYAGSNAVTLVGTLGSDILSGGSGLDTLDYSASLAGVAVNLGVSTAQNTGGAGTDTLSGFENLIGTAFNDVLTGTAGANIFVGGKGADTIAGGAGFDTAVYAGAYRSYAVSAGATSVSGGPDGGDALTGVERLQFVDGYFSTATTDTAASVYRLYRASLGRTPDAAGLASWTQAIDLKGAALQAVASGFLASSEFLNRYGSGSDSQFVALLYANVLNRAPDAQGLSTWLGFLGSGHSRAEALIGFSESAENISLTSAGLQQGVWIGDPNAGVVARFYDAVFDRLPDAVGLETWTKALNSGSRTEAVAAGFVNAQEFQATYGSVNDSQFVSLLYRNVLHRSADQPGLAGWLGLLGQGHSRAEVLVGFSESAEHIQLLAPQIDQGVWIA